LSLTAKIGTASTESVLLSLLNLSNYGFRTAYFRAQIGMPFLTNDGRPLYSERHDP